MVERRKPRFVFFAHAGDGLEGLLVDIERKRVNGTVFTVYTLEYESQLTCFFGTEMINEKIQIGDVGRWIRIRYEGDDTSLGRGGRTRVYRVFVSGSSARTSRSKRRSSTCARGRGSVIFKPPVADDLVRQR
jgi:hypothetical protein